MLGTAEPGVSAGSVHVYERTGNSWSERQILLPPDTNPLENFGTAIALHAGRAFIAAPGHDIHEEADEGGYVKGGAVYEFVRVGGQWRLRKQLTSPDTFNGLFGARVAFNGKSLLVLQGGHSNEQNRFGHQVYVYEPRANCWKLKSRLVGSPEDVFGSLALGGNWSMIGAYDIAASLGVVYAYDLDQPPAR